jgi:predicted RNase H-like nuclease (RuvC/YqgF family)
MGENEVIVMKQGPFLNNSKNAIAIHKCKYEDIERNEMKIVKLNEENEELKKKMSDLLLLMEHLEFELSNCKERKKKRNR